MDSKSCGPSGRSPVAGLDLSLRGAGVVVILPDRSLINKTFGYGLKGGTERDRVERCLWITSEVMKILRKHEVKALGVEDYAFSQSGRLTMLAELCGAIKQQTLVSLKTVCVPLASTSVRSFLIPNAKQKDMREKKSIQEYLKSQGFRCETADEYDALACALVCDVWLNDRGFAVTDQQLRMLDRMDSTVRRTHGTR